jgi:hypothetical protein
MREKFAKEWVYIINCVLSYEMKEEINVSSLI